MPKNPLRGKQTVVRPATEADVDLLVAWHSMPEVARYWDGETFTREEMLVRLARADVDAYIVEENATPVGYLQAWFEADLPNSGGLDMFLIPFARGRLLGPDAARTLSAWLLSDGGMERLTVDPYLSNEVAIRGWVKAGFRPVENREQDAEHPAPWLLMAMDKKTLVSS